MSNEVNSVLEPSEKIAWQGGVTRSVLVFNLVLALLVVVGIVSYLFSQETINYTSNDMPATIAGSTVGWVVLVLGILFSFLMFFSNFVKVYTITNKRVLVRSGLIGTDFTSIYFTEVRSVNVNVGLVDKIFSVGTIQIDTGKIETVSSGSNSNRSTNTRTAYDTLLHVAAPYEIYKHFQGALSHRQESLYSGRADRENNTPSQK